MLRNGRSRLSFYVEVVTILLICYSSFVHAQTGGKPGGSPNAQKPNSRPSVEQILKKYTLEELDAELERRGNKALYGTQHSDLKNITSGQIIEYVTAQQKTLYGVHGTDRRRDFWEIQNPKELSAANSVVALVTSDHYQENASGLVLTGKSLGEEMNLCGDQNYFDQPVIAYCSGFVVASDLIATAGHCVRDDMSDVRVVFGYRRVRNAEKLRDATEIPSEDVFKVVKVSSRKLEKNGVDYAILKVDRPINDHLPLPLGKGKALSLGDKLYVIGFPSGLPMKMAEQGVVRKIATGYFSSNLDTFGGNSGSPVLRMDTMTVEGILVRGDTDYVRRDFCNVAFVCPSETGCRGEDATLISAITDAVATTPKAVQARKPDFEVFSSPMLPSGVGDAFSPEYTLVSNPAPAGYKIANVDKYLTGDRTCNQWSTCEVTIEGNRAVLHVKLQGHDEWLKLSPPLAGKGGVGPGQALSQAHMVVTYAPSDTSQK